MRTPMGLCPSHTKAGAQSGDQSRERIARPIASRRPARVVSHLLLRLSAARQEDAQPGQQKAVDFGKSAEAQFRLALHEELRAKRKVALRLGHLSAHTQWTIKPHKVIELLAGKIQMADLREDDVTIDIRQKGVDMRIGVDVSSPAFKKQVDQIVLMAGDADFVPAAKQARREGIDFVLDPMWQKIPANLNEHIDGLRSTCPQPTRRAPLA